MHEDIGYEVVQVGALYTRTEVCSLCHITSDKLISYIEHGLMDDLPDIQTHFQQAHVIRILRAMKLQQELELDIAHLTLIVSLLDTIAAQRSELDLLRKLVIS